VRGLDEDITGLKAVLVEIIAQDGYEGFGDPVSRLAYVERVASDALREIS
jgi:hypothetical protein